MGFVLYFYIGIILVMVIVQMNILMGMAVSDINKIQEEAELEITSNMVKMVLDLEKRKSIKEICGYSVPKRQIVEVRKEENAIMAFDSIGFSFRNKLISNENIWKMYEKRKLKAKILYSI